MRWPESAYLPGEKSGCRYDNGVPPFMVHGVPLALIHGPPAPSPPTPSPAALIAGMEGEAALAPEPPAPSPPAPSPAALVAGMDEEAALAPEPRPRRVVSCDLFSPATEIELSKSRDPSPPLPPPADPPSPPASPGATPICSPRSPPHENLFLVQSSRILLLIASLISQLC